MSTIITELKTNNSTTKLRASADWVKKPFEKRNLWQRIATIELATDKCYTVQPKNPNPPPKLSPLNERLWLTIHIAPALIIQSLWYYVVPESLFFHVWHPLFTFIFYHLAFIGFILRMIKHILYGMDHYGTFDEHHRPRDYVADKDVKKLILSVLSYTLVRTGIGLAFDRFDRNTPPSLGTTISWFVLIKLGLWFVTLDMFFWTYHRTVHKVPFLWKYHSKHHSTKHPSPLQSILADDVQEIIEIFLIPFATTFFVRLSAHEFWIAQCILVYIEAMGHSGMRVFWTHPIFGEILQIFGMDLTVEDHDLHHRNGKSGRNYGKQTRIFDRLFNTIDRRIEGIEK